MKTLLVTATKHLRHNSGIAFKYIKDIEDIEDIFICDFNSCKDCEGCMSCMTKEVHKCCIRDDFTKLVQNHYDRIIIISPIYFFGLKGSVSTFIDRLYPTNLNNTEIVLILFSGSEGEDSGIDCVLYRFRSIDNYCGTKSRILQVVTDDKLLDLSVYQNDLDSFLRGEMNEANKEIQGH